MNTVHVIVNPGGWGHVSDNPEAYLVVDVEEWVKVYHKEKDSYDSASEHATWWAAHYERNRRNGLGDRPQEEEPTPDPEPEPEPQPLAAEIDAWEGVQWLGAKAG